MVPASLPRPPQDAVRAACRALAEALGPGRVVTTASVLAEHGHGESFHPEARPDAVVWPRSVDEVASIMAVAAAGRLPVIPFGAGTSLEGHVAALAGGICIDLRELNHIGAPSTENFDVTVGAGVTRRELDARLRPLGLFFPVDPGADATIGGMVATGASGTTTVRYGAMRENVIALTVVDARGRVLRTHSRARKSSAGYDLTRLMIGSEGTLGVVCEATLRIHPVPEAVAAAQCTFGSLHAAVQCVMRVLQHAIPVVRIELVNEQTLEALNQHFGTAYPVGPTLLLEFAANSAQDVSAQARETAQIAAEFGGSEFAWATGEAQRRRLWHARHGALEATRALRPGCGVLVTDVCVPVSALADCIAATQADLHEHGLTASIAGHVGDGNFHTALLLDTSDPADVARGEAFHERQVRLALEHQGTCTGEHGVGYGKARFLPDEHGPAAVDMMRAIKHALDPDGILNPGKVLPSSTSGRMQRPGIGEHRAAQQRG